MKQNSKLVLVKKQYFDTGAGLNHFPCDKTIISISMETQPHKSIAACQIHSHRMLKKRD